MDLIGVHTYYSSIGVSYNYRYLQILEAFTDLLLGSPVTPGDTIYSPGNRSVKASTKSSKYCRLVVGQKFWRERYCSVLKIADFASCSTNLATDSSSLALDVSTNSHSMVS